MTEYPVEIINRARELWLTTNDNGKQPSFDAVAKKLNAQFGVAINRQTIHKWSQEFGWTLAMSEHLFGDAPPASGVIIVPHAEPTEEDNPVNWAWEKKKAKFLAEFSGIAEQILAAVQGKIDGQPALMFKDGESAIKAALALVEAIGKINSGKYDVAEAGDVLPKMNESQISVVMNFFNTRGGTETPNIRNTAEQGLILDAEVEP